MNSCTSQQKMSKLRHKIIKLALISNDVLYMYLQSAPASPPPPQKKKTSCKIGDTLPLKNSFSSYQYPPYLQFQPFPLPHFPPPSLPFNVDFFQFVLYC